MNFDIIILFIPLITTMKVLILLKCTSLNNISFNGPAFLSMNELSLKNAPTSTRI